MTCADPIALAFVFIGGAIFSAPFAFLAGAWLARKL